VETGLITLTTPLDNTHLNHTLRRIHPPSKNALSHLLNPYMLTWEHNPWVMVNQWALFHTMKRPQWTALIPAWIYNTLVKHPEEETNHWHKVISPHLSLMHLLWMNLVI
jgi:hypothetical protein